MAASSSARLSDIILPCVRFARGIPANSSIHTGGGVGTGAAFSESCVEACWTESGCGDYGREPGTRSQPSAPWLPELTPKFVRRSLPRPRRRGTAGRKGRSGRHHGHLRPTRRSEIASEGHSARPKVTSVSSPRRGRSFGGHRQHRWCWSRRCVYRHRRLHQARARGHPRPGLGSGISRRPYPSAPSPDSDPCAPPMSPTHAPWSKRGRVDEIQFARHDGCLCVGASQSTW